MVTGPSIWEEWYAVDRSGYVARFDFCEGAATPTAASDPVVTYDDVAFEVDVWMALHLATADAGRWLKPVEDLKSRLAWWGVWPLRIRVWKPEPAFYYVLKIATEDSIQAQQIADRMGAALISQPGGFFACALPLRPNDFVELDASNRCAGWFGVDPDDVLPLYGLIEYDTVSKPDIDLSDDGDIIAKPYSRREIPEHPLHIKQLPEVARAFLSRIRLDEVDFRTSAMIQPLEVFDHDQVGCEPQACAYLDSELTTLRAISGREALFLKKRDALRELADDCSRPLRLEMPD